jgi:glycosyltransferase involved in cell wall biosynthesis
MRPLRVVLVTHYFPSHGGGIERVAWEIARRLAASGHYEITWLASSGDLPPRDMPSALRCVPVPACNIAERRLGFPFPLWSPAGLARLAGAARAADVVHVHDCLYVPNIVAALAARLAGRAVIVTQHVGMIPYRNPLLRMLLAAANRAFGKLVLGRATQVAFVSATVLEYFRSFVAFRRPPLRVPNGVDGSVFLRVSDERRRALRRELGNDASPLFLFAGRFVEKKGLPLLERLARRTPRARWIFAGSGPLDPGDWRLGNVSVRRNAAPRELAALYQAADLLVLPSFGEGFPLVVQEAMACGTPALVGEDTAAGAPEAADLLLTERLASPDAESRWAKRLESVMAAPETLAALRSRVAEFAQSHWSWERCATSYAEILDAAVS